LLFNLKVDSKSQLPNCHTCHEEFKWLHIALRLFNSYHVSEGDLQVICNIFFWFQFVYLYKDVQNPVYNVCITRKMKQFPAVGDVAISRDTRLQARQTYGVNTGLGMMADIRVLTREFTPTNILVFVPMS
jgi:hypothetical protein